MKGPTELIVATFKDDRQAGKVLQRMRAADREDLLSVLNAAVVVKTASGKMSIAETQDVGGKQGALFGAISGGLLGLLGGPVGMLLGAAAGAATGGVAARTIDMGFSDAMLEGLRDDLQLGTSAIVALVRYDFSERVSGDLEEYGAKLFRHILKEDELQAWGKAVDSDATDLQPPS